MSTAALTATNIALKEWAVVCDELMAGRQVVLLRKGGILEQKKGFQIEHERFLLYPNTEHQSREQLKPQFHAALGNYGPPARESGVVRVPGWCQVVDIVKTADPAKLRALEPFTCWTQALFDMRINYKPEKPNYVVTVRACKFPEPAIVPYHADYAGCHSWVPLKMEKEKEKEQEVALSGAPVLSDEQFETMRQAVLKVTS